MENLCVKDEIFNYVSKNTSQKSVNEKNLIKYKNIQPKPFLKWAGGKGQLLKEIEKLYPFNGHITKYAEPFVGGGAVLFDVLSRFNLSEVYISDKNSELINTYKIVRDDVDNLIKILSVYQSQYISFDEEKRKEYYNIQRKRFNQLKTENNCIFGVEKAALMIFLNKTCFNGLYRVNKKGLFNVPIGAYKNPMICDEKNLRIVSEKLKNVDIICEDYRYSEKFIDSKTFVYFDPPYRPLTQTSGFTSYTENPFDDEEQKKLSEFFCKMNKKGAKILLSNSNPKNADINDTFFEDLYSGFTLKEVKAARMINSKSSARGKISELLITNF